METIHTFPTMHLNIHMPAHSRHQETNNYSCVLFQSRQDLCCLNYLKNFFLFFYSHVHTLPNYFLFMKRKTLANVCLIHKLSAYVYKFLLLLLISFGKLPMSLPTFSFFNQDETCSTHKSYNYPVAHNRNLGFNHDLYLSQIKSGQLNPACLTFLLLNSFLFSSTLMLSLSFLRYNSTQMTFKVDSFLFPISYPHCCLN
jgi:hypothetical protein